MRKRRFDSKTMTLIALLIMVMCLSIGFATLNTKLVISGSAEVEASTWDVAFDNLSDAVIVGNSTDVYEDVPPTYSRTKIEKFVVSLSSPGNSISYEFEVKNAGSIDAKIGSITIPTPTCTGNGTNATSDASKVCNYIAYTLTYTDSGVAVSQNDTLAVGETKSMTLKIEYLSTATDLPTDDVKISNLSIPITYVQD